MKVEKNEKRCSKCGRELPVSEFIKGRTFSDGLFPWCKNCRSQYNKEYGKKYRAENAERISDRLKRYYKANREAVVEKNRTRRESDEAQERERERSREYYLEHKEEYRERSYKWRRENPEREKELKRGYVARHEDQIREYRARFRREHPEKDLAYGARRRMLKGATVEEVDVKKIWKRDRGVCYLCGRAVNKSGVHYDHVIPLSRGGAHSEENLRVTHARCNLIKGSKLIEELDMRRFREE